ncbi:MAG: JAB domain-containing protein [Verrucomicrobiota bacterium]
MSDTRQPLPSHAGHRARLRERFQRAGFAGFSEHEIVELLLTLCIPRRDVKQPARELLKRFGSIRALLDAPPEALRETPGLGEVAPIALRIIRETATLYLQQGVEGQPLLNAIEKIDDFWRSRLGSLGHEVFEVGYLDSAYRLLQNGVERLQEGTIDRAAVYPRRVVEAALRRGASGLVLAHNHPNGVCRPSEADFKLTDAIANAAAPLSIRVVEHLILTRDAAYSFRRQGHLK